MPLEGETLLIHNVRIMDGTGKKAFSGEVLLSGEKILCVGKKGEYTFTNCKKMDGETLTLAPGFIDVHTHSDMSLFAAPEAFSSITQAVTTLVCGNCGLSPFPVATEEVREHLDELYKKYAEKICWKSYRQYAECLQIRQAAVNVLSLAGHNTLKACVYGYQGEKAEEGKEDPKKISSLAALLDETLSQGAGGLSTGLLYMPGRLAGKEELLALMQVLKKHAKIYATHLRNEGDLLEEAVKEALFLAANGSKKLQISHLKTALPQVWHKLPCIFDLVEKARERGLQVSADRYPWTYSGTSLSLVLPGKYALMTDVAIENKLSADENECRNLAEFLDGSLRDWGKVLLADTQWEKMKPFRGKSIKRIGEELSLSPGQTVLKILSKDASNAMGAFAGMSEENLDKILQKEYVCCGSDETTRPKDDILGRSHPRGFGSFPKFFRRLIALGFTQEEAVARMTSLPAGIFSLQGRGLVKEGFYADLILFDPEKFDSTADFVSPHEPAAGLKGIFVNGEYIRMEEVLAGKIFKRNGKVLKITKT